MSSSRRVLPFRHPVTQRTNDNETRACVCGLKKAARARLNEAKKMSTKQPPRRQTLPSWRLVFIVLVLVWTLSILYFVRSNGVSLFAVFQWSIAQWIPWPFASSFGDGDIVENVILECPVLDLSEKLPIESLVETLETIYGKDWRDRPLLLKGLWSRGELENENRRLSLQGLLQENLSIPFFVNASAPYALSPDANAPFSAIVHNMTLGKPHKIGSQLLVQTYPELIKEVAPTDVVTTLFGDYFQPNHVVGSGPFGLFPAMTTVPVFVARTGKTAMTNDTDAANDATCKDDSTRDDAHPRTDLHCEPIGNVAVQLRGEKQWLLVSPQHSFRIQPAAAPDGRAFFASFSRNLTSVPQYHVTTRAGDALWIPTWTWHRVDYVGNEQEVAIGGSLFHFRAFDFVRNNPLFALLIIPSLIKELIGYSTQ